MFARVFTGTFIMLHLYTIGVIAIISAISPGPDFIVISKYALSESRKAAIFCALGIAAGILVHACYCVLGLAIVISKSIVLFNLIKYLGATYLMYLGLKSLFSRSTKSTVLNCPQAINQPTKHPLQAFNEGLLVNVLNPKCSLFMLSVFTLVIEPNTSKWLQFGYGLEISTIALAWFSLLAYSISSQFVKNKFSRFQQVISKITGILLVVLGGKIMVSS